MVNNYVLQHCSPHYRNIINEGYIKSGKESKKNVMFGSGSSKYIYLTLMNDKYPVDFLFFVFYLSIDILFDYPFWIANKWHADDISSHIYIDPKKNNIRPILYKIIRNKPSNLPNLLCNQIIIDRRIPLEKYLIAVNTVLYKMPKTYEKKLGELNAVIIKKKRIICKRCIKFD